MLKRNKGNLTENRLILLQLASRFPAGIEHDEMVQLNMQYDWMLYFDLEQGLLELCEEKLLALQELDNRRFYRATAEALNVLDLYRHRIPMSIRTAIDEFARSNSQRMERQMELFADYVCVSAIDYQVQLRINEYFRPIWSMVISAPTEEHAQRICARFKNEGPQLYAHMLAQLTRDEET
ncbi:MAG: DUF4364 family protein [Eubacteriales bacterium]|nr:DUF4364 family protein [Eubacteriales bacterium]